MEHVNGNCRRDRVRAGTLESKASRISLWANVLPLTYRSAPKIPFKNTFNNIFKDGRGVIGLQSHYLEIEAGESEVRGQPGRHRELKVILGYEQTPRIKDTQTIHFLNISEQISLMGWLEKILDEIFG